MPLMLTGLQFLEIKIVRVEEKWRNVKVVQEHIYMNHKEKFHRSYRDGFKIDNSKIILVSIIMCKGT